MIRDASQVVLEGDSKAETIDRLEATLNGHRSLDHFDPEMKTEAPGVGDLAKRRAHMSGHKDDKHPPLNLSIGHLEDQTRR